MIYVKSGPNYIDVGPFRWSVNIGTVSSTELIDLPLSDSKIRAFVDEWMKRCSKPYRVGNAWSLYFESEDDAILFWLTFK